MGAKLEAADYALLPGERESGVRGRSRVPAPAHAGDGRHLPLRDGQLRRGLRVRGWDVPQPLSGGLPAGLVADRQPPDDERRRAVVGPVPHRGERPHRAALPGRMAAAGPGSACNWGVRHAPRLRLIWSLPPAGAAQPSRAGQRDGRPASRTSTSASRTMRPGWAPRGRLLLDVLHVGNPHTPVRLDEHRYRTVGAGAPSNPQYRSPVAYQPPMTARIGAEVVF